MNREAVPSGVCSRLAVLVGETRVRFSGWLYSQQVTETAEDTSGQANTFSPPKKLFLSFLAFVAENTDPRPPTPDPKTLNYPSGRGQTELPNPHNTQTSDTTIDNPPQKHPKNTNLQPGSCNLQPASCNLYPKLVFESDLRSMRLTNQMKAVCHRLAVLATGGQSETWVLCVSGWLYLQQETVTAGGGAAPAVPPTPSKCCLVCVCCRGHPPRTSSRRVGALLEQLSDHKTVIASVHEHDLGPLNKLGVASVFSSAPRLSRPVLSLVSDNDKHTQHNNNRVETDRPIAMTPSRNTIDNTIEGGHMSNPHYDSRISARKQCSTERWRGSNQAINYPRGIAKCR